LRTWKDEPVSILVAEWLLDTGTLSVDARPYFRSIIIFTTMLRQKRDEIPKE